eukprot:GFUD01028774.1.p1 GENE.GFUD01028774.1~~GFUD01028774.1.p1  ORF type:complete len:140 (+),score=24.20 GFUD01028774.1:145-564(+)
MYRRQVFQGDLTRNILFRLMMIFNPLYLLLCSAWFVAISESSGLAPLSARDIGEGRRLWRPGHAMEMEDRNVVRQLRTALAAGRREVYLVELPTMNQMDKIIQLEVGTAEASARVVQVALDHSKGQKQNLEGVQDKCMS